MFSIFQPVHSTLKKIIKSEKNEEKSSITPYLDFTSN